jgi:uncharacterized membrane protein (UPF0182 family)
MAARMEPGSYGELVVYEMPANPFPDGPGIAASNIQADSQVSEEETLLSGSGSDVLRGNLLLIPVDNALLYVQPWYVVPEEETRRLPQLERVIVNYGDQVVIESTLQEALESLFGERVATLEEPDEPSEGEAEGEPDDEAVPPEEGPGGAAAAEAAELLAQADELFAEADEALADGDLAGYQSAIQEARQLLEEANAILSGEAEGDGEGADGESEPPSDDETTTTTGDVDVTPA